MEVTYKINMPIRIIHKSGSSPTELRVPVQMQAVQLFVRLPFISAKEVRCFLYCSITNTYSIFRQPIQQ